jgi:hypothetical protein
MADKDERTAEDSIRDERCPIPRNLYEDLSVISTQQKKTNCEVQEEMLRYAVDRFRNRAECQARRDNGSAIGEECKCSEV